MDLVAPEALELVGVERLTQGLEAHLGRGLELGAPLAAPREDRLGEIAPEILGGGCVWRFVGDGVLGGGS